MAKPGSSRWALVGLAVIAATGIVAVVVLGVPLWLAPRGRFTTAGEAVTAQNQIRTTLLQGLGGGVLLLGAYLTWRQLQHNISASQEQRELDRQGQLTQRFGTAIDQLGNQELAVRMGGIYTLARIARSSPEDRTAVVEVLAAYVRERAPWPPTRPDQLPADASLSDQVGEQGPASDVLAAMIVLGEIPRRGEPVKVPQLPDVDLRKALLGDAAPPEAPIRGWLNFEQATLARAHLEGTVLRGARLAGAILWQACLAKAYLPGADLREASLIEADLHGADLRGACLAGAKLQQANLTGADLRGADLRGAAIEDAQLQSAITDKLTIPPDPAER
jgi:membrane protein implicated in regulation of membrane protease activity